MKKERIDNQRVDETIEKWEGLDDICHQIFLTLAAYGKLRFNELDKFLKRFGIDVKNPVLVDHLNHLRKQKLIKRKIEGFQNVSYDLTDKIKSQINIPEENVKRWIENITKDNDLSKKLGRTLNLDRKEYLSKLPEEQLDEMTASDLNYVLTNNLFELKTFIDYDLNLDTSKGDRLFWKFVANPMYRMSERNIADTCRDSERYRVKLFEKIDALIAELRPDKEFLREREERRKKQTTK